MIHRIGVEAHPVWRAVCTVHTPCAVPSFPNGIMIISMMHCAHWEMYTALDGDERPPLPRPALNARRTRYTPPPRCCDPNRESGFLVLFI